MTNLILACIGIGIFIAYNIAMICLFGVPCSLSNTYYLLQQRFGKNFGWCFTAMLYVVCSSLLAPWIEVTTAISEWSQHLVILPCLAVGFLLFVGTAPNFRENPLPQWVHVISALLTALFSLSWVLIVCWKVAYIILIWILLCGAIAHLTKTARSGRDWWLEMVAFGSTFTTILVEIILHL